MFVRLLVVAALACGPSVKASAAIETIQDLRKACLAAERIYQTKKSNDDDIYEAGFCLGFMSGMKAVAGWQCMDGDRYPKNAIRMKDMTNGAWIRAFLLWADKAPEAWGDPASALPFYLSRVHDCRG